jgi:sugar lactone lactonase YvrE
VDPLSGQAVLIDLGGGSVPNGDGILLVGSTLYVVQNALNQIAVIQLGSGLASGTIIETITNPNFQVPTTIARSGRTLYVVNAKFGTPPTPDTPYEVVKVTR